MTEAKPSDGASSTGRSASTSQYQRVRVRDMTQKWGSCSTAGTITLATDLDNQDVEFQNFVIAHELLHLRVSNHGRLFKALMTAHVPDWKEHDIAK